MSTFSFTHLSALSDLHINSAIFSDMTRWLNSPLKRRYSQIWKGSSSKSQQKTHKFIRGRYKFLHQLGQGTSGTVYLAIDIDTNKQYAIKEINKSWLAKQHRSKLLHRCGPPSRKSNPTSNDKVAFLDVAQTKKRRLNNAIVPQQHSTAPCTEIVTLKELPHHTNIIRFIDTFEDPQYPDALYIVMEVAEKGIVMDVSSYEKCKPYSESMCKTIFKQLVEAVEHLHKNNIVHRDIKPQNLVQTKDNIIKLIDFGSAMDVNKCHNYQIGKSPAFMAPELLNKAYRTKEYSSFSSDIWAMGVTLFCLINGHLPFQQLSLPDLYQDILIENVRHDNTKASMELCDLINQILEKDPRKRLTLNEIKMHPWLQTK